MVTKPQPFLSFPLRRPEASFRTQDTLLDLFLDGAAGPEAEPAPFHPPFGFIPPVRKPLDAGVSENTMALLDNLITAEIRRLARTRPRVRAASMTNEGPRLRRALRNSRSGAVRPPMRGPRQPSPRSGVAADDAIFGEDQPDPNMVFGLPAATPPRTMGEQESVEERRKRDAAKIRRQRLRLQGDFKKRRDKALRPPLLLSQNMGLLNRRKGLLLRPTLLEALQDPFLPSPLPPLPGDDDPVLAAARRVQAGFPIPPRIEPPRARPPFGGLLSRRKATALLSAADAFGGGLPSLLSSLIRPERTEDLLDLIAENPEAAERGELIGTIVGAVTGATVRNLASRRLAGEARDIFLSGRGRPSRRQARGFFTEIERQAKRQIGPESLRSFAVGAAQGASVPVIWDAIRGKLTFDTLADTAKDAGIGALTDILTSLFFRDVLKPVSRLRAAENAFMRREPPPRRRRRR